MPIHARGSAVVTWGEGFYLFGGMASELDSPDLDSPPVDDPEYQKHAGVFHYDAATGQWASKTRMPAGLFVLSAHALGDKIYVFGGYGAEGFDPSVQVYDPVTDEWSLGPAMTTSRYNFSSSVVDGKVYVIGGQWWPAQGDPGDVDKRDVEVFDPASGWSTRTPVRYTASGAASCALDGRVYVFGGETGNRTQVYDVATDTWSEASSPPVARDGHICVRVGSAFFLLGGRHGPELDVAERYEPATDSWSSLPPLPTPRVWHGAAALGPKIWVFGGQSTEQGDSVGLLSSVEVLDTSALP